MPKVKSTDSHHEACARVLMKDFGVPLKMVSEVISLVKDVYHSERFAHCLIVQSVGGFFQPQRTRELQYFLQENGRRKPTRTKKRMLSSEEY
jgi:hypothetical protein